ncbi:FecCD family ABC transporter permease [Psychroflexus sediminis]|uniref:Iron complex transport system permease protein n=1 Tax=Psychroflexus sediminis TaxID=470826 RepID=A0A1G7VCG3_9FLAO|nr:iron ABC transporter permease [Psychroflexus sediminis]SDG57496.1 iron complex transport system permease protein [Psychroflexus sediminis]
MSKSLINHILLLSLLFLGIILSLSLGSVSIPFLDILKSLLGSSLDNSTWEYIILQYRLPKTITAILIGSGLAVSGLLMQTLFRNPLAGPYVLGLSSGASLGVAFLIMGAGLFSGIFGELIFSKWAIILAASGGSLLVMLAVLSTAQRVKDTMTLLIIGLMVASLTSAIVSILAYFSDSNNLQLYIFWSFGSLGNLSWQEVGILAACWFTGLGFAIFCLKNLNALLLGENYAKSMGVQLKSNRVLIIVSTSVLAGSATAFAGPIAFVGLAVPHLIRQLIPTNDHRVLLPSIIVGGAILMLVCDVIAQLPGNENTLPINAVTSLFGAPVVIWLLLRKRKLNF